MVMYQGKGLSEHWHRLVQHYLSLMIFKLIISVAITTAICIRVLDLVN